ncbi:organic cation transporter protein-like [Homarus americanus]|uniref:organic cation transporter protein-like n=1 Tax=Homarus americanus TaxID=6706 RepID=UPI001C44A522|nr:organic cation transporter protein-like [Homarus americanus]XP_042203246.1 organic cation transporter protein-like [Homarus americanus]
MATGQLDDVLRQLGTGPWNLLHFLVVAYGVSLPSPHTLAGAFLAPKVNYTCTSYGDDDFDASNNTYHTTTLITKDECSVVQQLEPSGLVEEHFCTQWLFDTSTFTTTVTAEFSLVCEWEYLRATYQSIYMLGVFVGAPLNGLLADRYGRKRTLGIAYVIYTILSVVSSWLPGFTLLLLSRFILGTTHATILKTGFILAMEMSSPNVRSVLGITVYLPWALGTMAWGGAAYLLREWRWLQLAVSLPWFLLLPAVWFMDESPRWLSVRGRYQEALAVLKRAARWNKAALPPDPRLLLILQDNQHEVIRGVKDNQEGSSLKRKLSNVFILFRTPRLRVISMVTFVDYLVVGMVYFGLSLSGDHYTSDVFTYMVLTGVMELPAYTLMAPVVARCGRRLPLATGYLLSAVVLLALTVLPSGGGWVVMSLAMAGKVTISVAFQVLNLQASELFPTEVRTRGASTAFMMSRVGSMASPFITEYLGSVYPWAPSVMFGVSSVVAGVATLALPETLDAVLPDTIAQLENRRDDDEYRGFLRLPTKASKQPPQELQYLHHHTTKH